MCAWPSTRKALSRVIAMPNNSGLTSTIRTGMREPRSGHVRGQDDEAASLQRGRASERALIESQDTTRPVPVRQYYEGGIGKAEPQITVPFDDSTCGAQFVPRQALDDVRARREVLEESELDADSKACQDKVVCFGDGQLRRHERLALVNQDPRDRVVPR